MFYGWRSHEHKRRERKLDFEGKNGHSGIILLTSNGDRAQPAVNVNLERAGARSLILIERPVRLVTLASTVQSLLQSRRRQHEIRDYLEERARNETRLRETQKLESIGHLAGGIAHDFNNILTGVLGNASLALDDGPPARFLPRGWRTS